MGRLLFINLYIAPILKRIDKLKNRIFSSIVIVLILFQISITIPLTAGNLKEKPVNSSFTVSNEIDELLPNNFRIQKRTLERTSDYNYLYSHTAADFGKGNSLFFIHNQSLPRTLIEHIIHSSFFTSYFSTAL